MPVFCLFVVFLGSYSTFSYTPVISLVKVSADQGCGSWSRGPVVESIPSLCYGLLFTFNCHVIPLCLLVYVNKSLFRHVLSLFSCPVVVFARCTCPGCPPVCCGESGVLHVHLQLSAFLLFFSFFSLCLLLFFMFFHNMKVCARACFRWWVWRRAAVYLRVVLEGEAKQPTTSDCSINYFVRWEDVTGSHTHTYTHSPASTTSLKCS